MDMKIIGKIFAAFALISLNFSASAAVISSIDRSAFASAALSGTISVEDFDGFPDGTILGVTPEVTYSALLGPPIVVDNFVTTTSPNSLGSDFLDLGFFVSLASATFEFADPITAFAIDINTFAADDGDYTATLNTGDVVTSLLEVFPNTTTGQFIGFISSDPFTSVTVAAIADFGYTLDTLVYGDASAVPEPSAAALLMLGIAVMLRRHL